MVKQYTLRQTAREADWNIGVGLFTDAVHGRAIRSMAEPGSAYDDPVLGRDPQPAHMRNYVETDDDNGGVHINSGIPNHAFYLGAIELGGYSWEVLGPIYYTTLTTRLAPNARFLDFAQATVDVAGELFGTSSRVRQVVQDAWTKVGIQPRLPASSSRIPPLPRPAPLTTNVGKENTIMSTDSPDLQHRDITASMFALHTGEMETEMEIERNAIADTPKGRVQRLIKIYASVKPLLLALSTLVLIPATWRSGIKVFIGALDAVAVVAPQLGTGEAGDVVKIDDPQTVPDFKAGKDL
jgi:hypothetical protein